MKLSDSENERISRNAEIRANQIFGRDMWGKPICHHFRTRNVSLIDFRQKCLYCDEILPIGSRECCHPYTNKITDSEYDIRRKCNSCGRIIYE